MRIRYTRTIVVLSSIAIAALSITISYLSWRAIINHFIHQSANFRYCDLRLEAVLNDVELWSYRADCEGRRIYVATDNGLPLAELNK